MLQESNTNLNYARGEGDAVDANGETGKTSDANSSANAAFLSSVILIASGCSFIRTVVDSNDPIPFIPHLPNMAKSSSHPEVGVVNILSPC
jgi:hypothetical protein